MKLTSSDQFDGFDTLNDSFIDKLRTVIRMRLSTDKKTLKLTEDCDQFFSVDLNKDEVEELLVGLHTIHDMMVS